MPTWIRVLLVLSLWSALLADLATGIGGAQAAYLLALPASFATGWLLGWPGGAASALLALFLLNSVHGGVSTGTDVDMGGSLIEPLAMLAFGLGGAWVAYLQRQLATQRQASIKAQFDPLTGVLNRAAFEMTAHRAMAESREQGDVLALLFVDLDRFKFVNDTYGHEIGDKLLRRVASLLGENVRQHDLVGRLGGDEFTVAVRGLREEDSAKAVARKLLSVLNEPHLVDGRLVQVSASIGIAIHPRDGETVDQLLKNADHAMYQVKEGGKNGVFVSTMETQAVNGRRIELEQQLKVALQEDEFELHYQPKVDLRSRAPVGVEMLLRWRNRELGLVSPEEFIPMAEETGLIVPLGRWLMRQACHQLKDWDRAGLPPIELAVNVSTLQFRQPDFVTAVEDALRDSGLPAERLEIEITESVLMRDFEPALKTLERLDKLGVRIALDDFGTGYSSLAYLQKLPIGTLKIDRQFVGGLELPTGGTPGGTAPIVEAIVLLAKKLGKTVVAEGIERPEQARWLASIGCHQAQGYLYAKPLAANVAATVLRKAQPQRKRIDVEGDALLVSE